MKSSGKHNKSDSMGRRVKSPGGSERSRGRIRLPLISLGRINKSVIYGLVVTAVLAGSLWLGYKAMERAKLSDIRVEGNYFTPEADVLRAIDVEQGTPLDSLNYLDLIDQVEEVSYVKRANLDISATGRMTVTVDERRPQALLAGSSMDSYVDSEGVRLNAVPGKSVDVPLVYMPDREVTADSVSGRVFEKMSAFLEAAATDPMVYHSISEVAYDSEEGVTALSDDNAVRLVFGHENFERRVRNWRGFYTNIIPEKGMQQMRRIDMRFENQIVTRER